MIHHLQLTLCMLLAIVASLARSMPLATKSKEDTSAEASDRRIHLAERHAEDPSLLSPSQNVEVRFHHPQMLIRTEATAAPPSLLSSDEVMEHEIFGRRMEHGSSFSAGPSGRFRSKDTAGAGLRRAVTGSPSVQKLVPPGNGSPATSSATSSGRAKGGAGNGITPRKIVGFTSSNGGNGQRHHTTGSAERKELLSQSTRLTGETPAHTHIDPSSPQWLYGAIKERKPIDAFRLTGNDRWMVMGIRSSTTTTSTTTQPPTTTSTTTAPTSTTSTAVPTTAAAQEETTVATVTEEETSTAATAAATEASTTELSTTTEPSTTTAESSPTTTTEEPTTTTTTTAEPTTATTTTTESTTTTTTSTTRRLDVTPERIYGVPEEIYGQPEKVYGQPEKVYGQPEKVYGQPEKVYGEPEKVYATPEVTYVTPEVNHGIAETTQSSIRPEAPLLSSTEAEPFVLKLLTTLHPITEFDSPSLDGHQGLEVINNPLPLDDVDEEEEAVNVQQLPEAEAEKYLVEEKTPDGHIVGEFGVISRSSGSLIHGVRYVAHGSINPDLIKEALRTFLSLK